jgi:hypothetical protein
MTLKRFQECGREYDEALIACHRTLLVQPSRPMARGAQAGGVGRRGGQGEGAADEDDELTWPSSRPEVLGGLGRKVNVRAKEKGGVSKPEKERGSKGEKRGEKRGQKEQHARPKSTFSSKKNAFIVWGAESEAQRNVEGELPVGRSEGWRYTKDSGMFQDSNPRRLKSMTGTLR